MSNMTITIVGTGAIGTSLGLALKQLNKPLQLIAHDKELSHAQKAVGLKAFDKAEWNLINACEEADLIILAIPAIEIKPTLEAIAQYLKKDCVISDTSQTKHAITNMASEILPDTVHFVGGHPIVTTTGTGTEHANSNLFKDVIYCLTPSSTVSAESIQLLQNIITLIGATPFFLDPLEHDGLMSGVNTLPKLLSIALIHGVSQPASWIEMRKLAGELFSHVSAGCTGDSNSLAEGLINNKTNNLRWLRSSMESLQTLIELIEREETEPLAKLIDDAVIKRHRWQHDFEERTLSNLKSSSITEVERPNVFKQLFGFRMPRRKDN